MTPSLAPPLRPPPRDVLVLRALPGLGDWLCATPALRALRAALPDATITLLGLPEARAWIDRYPHLVDALLESPGLPGLPERPVDAGALRSLLAAHAGRFDLALQLHGSGVASNLALRSLAARRCAGFYAPPLPCPDPAAFAPYPAGLAEPLAWLALLAFLGVPARGEHLEFPARPGDDADLDAILSARGLAGDARLAVLHVSASKPACRLAPGLLAAIADGLAARGLTVVLTGRGDDEAAIAGEVEARAACRPHALVGRTPLGALAALLRQARLVIAGDTGVSHLASALRTPSVVVFLATDVDRWAPLDRRRHRVVDGRRGGASAATILAEADAALPLRRWTEGGSAGDLRAARRVLVIPPAAGGVDLTAALRRLRATLPGAALVLLGRSGPAADRLRARVDEVIAGEALGRCDAAGLAALVDRLAAARLDAALILTATGESAFEAAYLAYLAGVPVRAGLAAEFGGGVLSPWVRPPPHGLPEAGRALCLLHELGL